ncbi:MAG: GAF domain-containing protein [Gammaproteobacteria bacterium]
MTRYRAVLVPLTLVIIALLAMSTYGRFHVGGLPFTPRFVDVHTASVEPISGIQLPQGLQAGDLIDIPALDHTTRAALFAGGAQDSNMSHGVIYPFVIKRGATSITVPVTIGNNVGSPMERLVIRWVGVYLDVLLSLVVVLALWLGRNREARFLVLWGLAYIIADAMVDSPLSGMTFYHLNNIEYVLYFVGRFAMYGIAESLAGDALSVNQRMALRAGLALTLLTGLTVVLGGAWLLVYRGSAAWINPALTWVIASPYIVSAIALLVAYYRTKGAQRIRIRWMLWSLAPFFVGILARDISVLSYAGTFVVADIGLSLGASGILYAILRHRMVDVNVVIDKTLVYGATTTLVVGVLAAVNSLALRATLGEGAGLLLQIVVPLALGIVLSRVRGYMDRIVERVFFRRRYLAQRALRLFAKRCGYIEELPRLLDAAVAEIRRHIRSPGVAFYELVAEGCIRLRESGEITYPPKLDKDDPAVVAIRAERKPVDLAGSGSQLSVEGWVFPIIVLGRLRGLAVCANRPGEHYAADEQQLLNRVVRNVGAAWRILRARDNEDLVRALAMGTLEPVAARQRAQTLEASWAKG